MRLHTASLCALAMAAAAFQAQAQQPSVGHLDAYYIPNADYEETFENLILKDDGDGFGFKGRALFADQLFFAGEYQSTEYDDSELELDQLRFGIGYLSAISPMADFLVQVEYIKADQEIPGFGSEDENGFGVHVGAIAKLAPAFSMNATVGFVSVGDFDGTEFLVGARFQASPVVSVFMDYRMTRLSDSGADLDLDDLRLGAGFHF